MIERAGNFCQHHYINKSPSITLYKVIELNSYVREDLGMKTQKEKSGS